jgi:transposase
MRAIYALVDEEDYLELRKRLLEERKSLAQWVRERIKEYLKEDRNTVDKAPSGK